MKKWLIAIGLICLSFFSKAQISSIDSFNIYQIQYDLSTPSGGDTLWVKKSDVNSIGDTMWYRTAGTGWIFYQNGDVKSVREYAVGGRNSSGIFNPISPTINNSPGRSFNSNYTISTTGWSIAIYSVSCTATNPLLIGSSTADIFLEYSMNGVAWQGAIAVGNSNSVGLTVSVQLTDGQKGTIVGVIPKGALVRLRTAITGSASVTYNGGQESSF